MCTDFLSGLAVVYALGRFRVIISTRTHIWYASVQRFELDSWTKLSVSWQIEFGLAIFIDSRFVTRTFTAVKRTMEISVVQRSSLVIGGEGVRMAIEDVKILFATAEECGGVDLIRIGE